MSPLGRRKVQTAGEIRAADFADEVRIATHDQLIAGTGQANVAAFAGAFERGLLVDDAHEGAAFEPLEAKDMAIEDLVGIPGAVPVGGVGRRSDQNGRAGESVASQGLSVRRTGSTAPGRVRRPGRR